MEAIGIRGNFIERFVMFREAYGRMSSKVEKSYLADFLKTCRFKMVREVKTCTTYLRVDAIVVNSSPLLKTGCL